MTQVSLRPTGGREAHPPADYDVNPISTHAPHAGRDITGGAEGRSKFKISILAPCAGRDGRTVITWHQAVSYFNPRAPCGARRPLSAGCDCSRNFNPRAPCGARLCAAVHGRTCRDFNPRALCGVRPIWRAVLSVLRYFNPRALCGARGLHDVRRPRRIAFQSARPVRGATCAPCCGEGRSL